MNHVGRFEGGAALWGFVPGLALLAVPFGAWWAFSSPSNRVAAKEVVRAKSADAVHPPNSKKAERSDREVPSDAGEGKALSRSTPARGVPSSKAQAESLGIRSEQDGEVDTSENRVAPILADSLSFEWHERGASLSDTIEEGIDGAAVALGPSASTEPVVYFEQSGTETVPPYGDPLDAPAPPYPSPAFADLLDYTPTRSAARRGAHALIGKTAPTPPLDEWTVGRSARFDFEHAQGRVLVVYAFQSWCPGCQSRGFPHTQALQARFREQSDVAVLYVQTPFEGHETNTFERLVHEKNEWGITLSMAQDSVNEEGTPSVMSAFHTGGTPWHIIIDKTGVVRFNDFTPELEVLERIVEGLL